VAFNPTIWLWSHSMPAVSLSRRSHTQADRIAEHASSGSTKRTVKSSTSLILWIASGAIMVLIVYTAEGSQFALVVLVAWLVARLFRDIGWFLRLNDRGKGQKHDDERK
jgi:hypothetical protein